VNILSVAVVVIVVVVGGVLTIASTRPDTFRVVRSADIKAPPAKIYPLIDDFQRWTAWSPYEGRDTAMKRSFSGPTSGMGAGYSWEGNSQVGQGSMEIVDATPPSKIVLKLDFIKPFEAHNTVDFTLVAKGDATSVTWDMRGPVPFIGKIMHVFINMDRLVGSDFETGLANLKALAES
jgi:hypothetical protein